MKRLERICHAHNLLEDWDIMPTLTLFLADFKLGEILE
jgi:hypothetical protein